MKLDDIILEAADTKLLAFVTGNENFYEVDGCFVFIWTNPTLRKLIAKGAKAGAHLASLSVPSKGQVGLGILIGKTGELCVGAIDEGYEGLWVSSLEDARLFFRQIKNKKVLGLPGRLENLAGLLSTHDQEDAEKSAVKGSAAEKILTRINDAEELDDYYAILDSNAIISGLLDIEGMSGEEIKDHFRGVIKKLKHREQILKKQVDKIMDIIRKKENELSDEELDSLLDKRDQMGGNEMRAIETLVDDLNLFLKRESDLFIDDAEDTIDDELPPEAETDNNALKIDLWTDSFLADFPGLPLEDARQFDPNQE